jgi:transcriptional regulator with XRE-family HTH domain
MYSIAKGTQSSLPNKAGTAAFILLFGTGSSYAIQQTAQWREHVQPRVAFVVEKKAFTDDDLARVDVRTVEEHLVSIRNILNPSVADLASLFCCSRQAIYKWLAGSSSPEDDKVQQIHILSGIADAFAEAGIERADSLLKMKTFNGKSLLDLLKTSENKNEHVTALIAEARAMEANYARSGVSHSQAKSTNDWMTSISIPGSLERG